MSSKNTSTDIWIAGAFAAFTVDLLVYPLDTLKTRLQSPDYKRLYLYPGTSTLNKATLFRGLYQGIGPVVLATLPSSGAFFTTYESTKRLLTKTALPTPLTHATASALAELISCAILTPAEVIKQNAQMVTTTSTSTQSATAQTLARFRQNPLALWRGYGALAGRNLPFTALQFPMFEQFKEALKTWQRRRHGRGSEDEVPLYESSLVTAAAAGTAGAIAAVVTTPVDVVKTRIMLAAGAHGESEGAKAVEAARKGKLVDALGSVAGEVRGKGSRRKGSWEVAKEVVGEHGWKGLFRGGGLRAAWTMLGSGLYLSMYETGRIYLEKGRDAKGREVD